MLFLLLFTLVYLPLVGHLLLIVLYLANLLFFCVCDETGFCGTTNETDARGAVVFTAVTGPALASLVKRAVDAKHDH